MSCRGEALLGQSWLASTQPSFAGAPGEPAASRAREEPLAIVFVIKRGSDPIVVGQRIAGPNAGVSPAYPDRRPRENLPQTILLRTFVVTVPAGREHEALKRAQADADIELAYIAT